MHSPYLYSSYLSSEYLVLPSPLPCYSLDYLGRQLLNEPFLSTLFSLSTQVSPVPTSCQQLLCAFLRFFAFPPPSPIPSSFPFSYPLLLSLASPLPSPFPSCVRPRVSTPFPFPFLFPRRPRSSPRFHILAFVRSPSPSFSLPLCPRPHNPLRSRFRPRPRSCVRSRPRLQSHPRPRSLLPVL